MGRMQPVVMAPLSHLLEYVGLAGIRTHDLQQLNQAASHTAIMPALIWVLSGWRLGISWQPKKTCAKNAKANV